MEKRIIIRIIFESLDIEKRMGLEVALEEVLEKYGVHTLEISALTPRVSPTRPS